MSTQAHVKSRSIPREKTGVTREHKTLSITILGLISMFDINVHFITVRHIAHLSSNFPTASRVT